MNFKLELNEQQVSVIGQVLGKAPYEVVAPLIAEIQRQIDAQQMQNGGVAPQIDSRQAQRVSN